ncbi:hypothetical protein L210DRAFT_3317980, partial [Boletus edulis BED1]
QRERDATLHISVEFGGCHGYQYKMALANVRAPGDYSSIQSYASRYLTLKCVYIDAVSFPMLNGSTVDYATGFI